VPGTSVGSPGGIAVTRLAATDDPDDSTDDDEVTLVAVDRERGVVLTNFGLLSVGTWSGEGTPLGPLSSPHDVTLDPEGRVAITDRGNRRVVLLQHDGRSLEPVRSFDGFLEPTGIAAAGDGVFYVCDRRFNAVFRLDADTGARSTFGLEVAFDRPVDVAATRIGERLARGKRGGIAIADRDGRRLRLFGRAGDLRASRTAESLDATDASFDAIEIDYFGNVLAVDRAAHRIHKLRDDLLPLDTFGRLGAEEGQFVSPRGIAVHRPLGQVFVTEEEGGQYLWVGTDIRKFAARDLGRQVDFSFVLTEDSTVDIRVLDSSGELVAVLVTGRRSAAGPQRGRWDGRDRTGRPAPSGDYLAELRARATLLRATERVRGEAQAAADRVRGEVEDVAERMRGEAQAAAERMREEAQAAAERVRYEAPRKAVHLAAIVIPLGILHLPLAWAKRILIVGAAALLVADLVKIHHPKLRSYFTAFFGHLLRRHERTEITGSTYMVVSSLVVVYLFEREVAAAALIYLIVGDTLAAMVGKAWGRTPLFRKSLEGFLAMLVASFGAAWLLVPGLSPGVLAAGAMAAAIVEVLPIPVDDNFRIPLVAGLVLHWLG
jgi:dolichol kinase/sugar lactone lactonase YvrE